VGFGRDWITFIIWRKEGIIRILGGLSYYWITSSIILGIYQAFGGLLNYSSKFWEKARRNFGKGGLKGPLNFLKVGTTSFKVIRWA